MRKHKDLDAMWQGQHYLPRTPGNFMLFRGWGITLKTYSKYLVSTHIFKLHFGNTMTMHKV